MADATSPRDVFLNIRLTAAELDAIKRAATQDRRTPSAYVRMRIGDLMENEGWLKAEHHQTKAARR